MTQVLADLSFPVSLRKNKFEGNSGLMTGEGQQVYREDKNKSIANVSDDYGLVKHSESLRPALAALDGLDFDIQKLRMDGDGRRVSVTALSRKRWTVGKLQNGGDDNVTLALCYGNSYDRTKALSLSFGAYRFICSNGMKVAHPAFAALNIEAHVVHSKNAVRGFDPVALANNMAGVYAAMEKQVEAWAAMRQREIAKTAIESLKEKLLAPIVGARAAELVMEKAISGQGQDGRLTAWALYNGLTEVLTGKVEKSKSPVNAQTIYGTKETTFLGAFETWQEENAEQLVTVSA